MFFQLCGHNEDMQASSRMMFISSMRFALMLITRAFQECLIRNELFVGPSTISENDFLSAQLQTVVAYLRSDGTLLGWFSKVSVSETVKVQYADTISVFMKRPVFSSKEVQKLYQLLARPPTPAQQYSDQVTKETLWNLKMLQERRKKEINDAIKRYAL